MEKMKIKIGSKTYYPEINRVYSDLVYITYKKYTKSFKAIDYIPNSEEVVRFIEDINSIMENLYIFEDVHHDFNGLIKDTPKDYTEAVISGYKQALKDIYTHPQTNIDEDIIVELYNNTIKE